MSLLLLFNKQYTDHTSNLSDGLTITEGLAKGYLHITTDTAVLSDLLVKFIGSNLGDSIGFASALYKGQNNILSDQIVLTDDLVKAYLKITGDTVSLTDLLAKLLSNRLVDSINLLDALYKWKAGFITDGVTLTDDLVKGSLQNLADMVILSDLLNKSTTDNLADIVSLTDGIGKGMGKLEDDLLGVTDAVLFGFICERVFNENLTIADFFKRGTAKAFTDSVVFEENYSIQNVFIKQMVDSLMLSDNEGLRVVGKSISDMLALLDVFHRGREVYNADFISFADITDKGIDLGKDSTVVLTEENKKDIAKVLLTNITLLDAWGKRMDKIYSDSLSFHDLSHWHRAKRVIEWLIYESRITIKLIFNS